ncbi:MAG: PIN domain-containing protein [Nanoarchaeota archaeon]
MKIVIDTNVLMAGLLKDSIVRIILSSENIKFFLPEYSINEIKKHEKELIEKSGYDKEELDALMNLLLENIDLVPQQEIRGYMKKAESIMKDIDIKDSSFIATAMAIKADGILSFDKHFLLQKIIKIFNVKELMDKI